LLLPVSGWVAGIAIARCEWIDMQGMLLLAVLSAGILLVQRRKRPKPSAFILASFMLAGLLWGTSGLLSDAAKISVPDSWLHTQLEITADIKAVQQQGNAWRLTLGNVQRNDGERLQGLVWLYVYQKPASDPVLWLPGERIAADARLHRPRNQHNPSGFDFAAWCFDRHIALLGAAHGEVRRVSSEVTRLEYVRQKIRQSLAGLPDEKGGVIRALLLGERSDIPERVYAAFAATGAAHLLAISGLHIGLVAGMGFVLCWFVLTRREAWIVRLPVRGLSLLAGVLLAMLYAQLADWPLPTQRAALMLAGAALAWWLRARVAPLNVLLAALMLILLVDSSAVVSLSLWLSFTATAGILLWAGRDAHAGHEQNQREQGLQISGISPAPAWLGWLRGLFMVTLVASIVTLPLAADVFGRLPVYSLPANLLATPLYTLFVLPLSLFAALLSALGLHAAAMPVFSLAGLCIELGNTALSGICEWPGGMLWLTAIPLWLSALYALGMLAVFALLMQRKRVAGVAVLSLTLMGYAAMGLQERGIEQARMIVWDIGQGAATSLILPGGKVMVIDVAGRFGSRFNAGTSMAEGLRGLGLTHIDVLLISHNQADHVGGAFSLLHRVNRISELWLADVPENRESKRIKALQHQVFARGGVVRWLSRGDDVAFAGAEGEVLWPPQAYAPANVNDDSLVLHLRLPTGQRLLFGGDIEAPVEAALLSEHRQALRTDIMLMPHHGSASSSTQAFVAATRPSLVIAQTGYANRYGFPHPNVEKRYRAIGADVMNTADGAVILDLHAAGEYSVSPVPPVESLKRNRALQWWQHFL